MVGERDVVEEFAGIVGIERAPAAVARLQALDPFAGAGDRRVEGSRRAFLLRALHAHDDDGGVVEIGIMRIGILEGPAAGPHSRALECPVALDRQLLQREQPIEPALCGRDIAATGFEQRVGSQRGVPDRRNAGLAIGFVVLDDEQLVD